MASNLRSLVSSLGPKWLTTDVMPDGTEVDSRFLYTVALLLDAFLQRLRDGVMARFPGRGPDDALPLIGRDRIIIRGPSESTDAYVVRLLRAIDDHRTRGNAYTLQEQLRGFCSPHLIRSATVDQRANWKRIDRDGTRSKVLATTWDWDGTALAAAKTRWWLLVYPTTGTPKQPWAKAPAWGTTGKKWGTAGATWGSTATPDDVAGLRSIVRDWKPAGTRCVCIIVVFDDTSPDFDPSTPGPDGTWGHWSKNVAGVQVPARSPDAIYIDAKP